VRYQILIPHIPHRHDKFCQLLETLKPQMRPGVEVLVYADNLEATYCEKLQTLADAADADYTSHLANDDSVAPDYIDKLWPAFDEDPDYIGFRVKYTLNGERGLPVIHSAMHSNGWWDEPTILRRDFMYYNPIRRSIADQIRFRGLYCDMEWAEDVRNSGLVKREVFIDDELHYYQTESADNFFTGRQPMPVDEIPELPSYPFVRYIEATP
jgi:hypothetical protein